jgi:hypothetical protein
MPTSTDLVTDLPADFETFGQAVDTSLADLKGGTSGQVLSKNSNTDMDFTWTTASSGSPFVAGKNAIINGDFGIWQRGTSFSNPADATYTCDRFMVFGNGSGATKTVSQQTFSAGTAPVAGYEGTFFWRLAQTVAGTGATYNLMLQRVENGRNFAGQVVTFSAWVKADASRTGSFAVNRNYGSGGSSMDYSVVANSNISITTSWQRFTYTFTMPSVSGKTFGSGSYLEFAINFPNNTAQTIDIWGVQVEANSSATNFSTATQTIQGELAACQRYYWRFIDGSNQWISTGSYYNAGQLEWVFRFPTPMRTAPTLIISTGTDYYSFSRNNGTDAFNSITLYQATTQSCLLYNSTEVSGTAGQAGTIFSNNASSSVALSAEL